MDGYVIIGTELDTKSFDAQIDYVKGQLNDIEDKLKQADMGFEVGDVQKLEAEYEKLSNKLSDLVRKKEEFTKPTFSNINLEIENIGKSTTKVIKKIGRWALAIFGIRSAYLAVRSAMNTLTQYDAQLKADIDYIKNALAFALEPVVRKVVDLAKQLLSYIAYIIKAWFNYDIFANANKHLKSANKSANELRKTLAGFDEMNILNDNVSGSGGGADILPDMPEAKGNTLVEWIAKNKDKVLAAIAGIVAGITAAKLGLSGIKALGIGVAVYGIIKAIQNFKKFLKDKTFTNFIETLKGIALAAVGVGLAIEAWPVLVAGAIAYVVLLLTQHLDKVIEKFEQFNNWIDKNVFGWFKKTFGTLGEILVAPFKYMILIVEGIFVSILGGIKKYIDGIILIFKGDFVGGIKLIFSGLAQILLGPFEVFYNGVKKMVKEIIDLFKSMKINSVEEGTSIFYSAKVHTSTGGRAKGGIFYPSKLPKLAMGGIINMPGRGIPYHGATIAERGAEAVIPLTDSQQMALLGETIGKSVNINATVPVYVGNRMVARELKRINAENDFAYNR